MSSTTKRQITIERHSITRIRISGKYRYIFCEVCQSETLAFTPEQVAKFLQISEPEVLRQIETGELHLVTRNSMGLVCAGSLDDNGSVYEKIELRGDENEK